MPKLKSPTKFKVLKAVNDNDGIESRDLARIMGISISHASKLLRDYWTQGLLIRKKRSMSQGGIRYFFCLSDPGKNRLNFFLKNFKIFLKENLE